MAEIKSLFGDAIPEGAGPDETTVRLFRDYLGRAERGEIVAAAVAALGTNGQPLACFTGGSSTPTLLGVMELVKHMMIVYVPSEMIGEAPDRV